MGLIQNKSLKTNGEGYPDPTAYAAIKEIMEEERRVSRLIHIIKGICDFAGFHVEGRIVLKDNKTGKIWR